MSKWSSGAPFVPVMMLLFLQGCFNGEQLLVLNVIIYLGWGKSFGKEGTWVKFVV